MNKADSLHAEGRQAAQQGRHEEAIDFFRRSLTYGPTDRCMVHNELACVYKAVDRDQEAESHWRQAIKLKPDFPIALSNLGLLFRNQGKVDLAIDYFLQAIAINPDYDQAHFNYGNILNDHGQFEKARREYDYIIDKGNKNIPPEVFNNYGVSLYHSQRPLEAISYYNETLCSIQGVAEAQYNIAMALLMLDRYREGWAQHEWRWHTDPPKSLKRSFDQPVWNGEQTKVLLIHAEQGYGDVMQFARYIPMAAERCEHLIFWCHPELRLLLEASFSKYKNVEIFAPSVGDMLPPFDTHLPMFSLARVFQTDLTSIPGQEPYFSTTVSKASEWHSRLVGRKPRWSIPIGLCWAGTPDHKSDARRSIPTALMDKFMTVPSVTWISLQKQDVGKPNLPMIDFTHEMTDFYETAGMINNLSQVITVDSAVAHLAAGLGKPVWLLNKFDTDWRWGLNRETSPWYPTMKIYRQPTPGDWDSVIDRVVADLKQGK